MELQIPIRRELSIDVLLAAIEADRKQMQAARQKAEEDALPLPVCNVYRRQEERLRAARDVLRFYVETSEESVTIDIDAPLDIELTPPGMARAALCR